MSFTSLLVQAAHGLSAVPVPVGEHPAAFRRSWLAGFAGAVTVRLRQAETAATSTPTSGSAPSLALVLADRSAPGRAAARRGVSAAADGGTASPARRWARRGCGGGSTGRSRWSGSAPRPVRPVRPATAGLTEPAGLTKPPA